MSALLELVLISAGLSMVLAALYRVLTKPDEIRRAKADVSLFRKKIAEARKAGNLPEANRHMGEMMKANQVQMRANMKPMLASLLVFALALGWLNSYGPTVTAETKNGTLFFGSPLNLTARADADTVTVDLNRDGEFQEPPLAAGAVFMRGEYFWELELPEGKPPTLVANVARSPVEVPLLKFAFPPFYLSHYLSWFWVYLFTTIPATILFRKLFGAE